MERSSEYHDLATALAELRPTPTTDFASELDRRVTAGFPRRSHPGRAPLMGFLSRVSDLSPKRLFFAGGATALAAIVAATIIVASGHSRSQRTSIASDQAAKTTFPDWSGVQFEAAPGATKNQSAAGAAEAGDASAQAASGSAAGQPLAPESLGASGVAGTGSPTGNLNNANASLRPFSRSVHREIERSAEIGLLADPTDVADDSAQVFGAVHDANGIVLRSTTTAGRHAGARFELLIPSARLGDALAAFSAIDEVRSRHEATADITAPTVTASEQLRDSRAKIDGLLTQLATAETEPEREAIESQLRFERRHAAGLRRQLDKLNRRADFSRVSLKIETGASETGSGGAWGIDDAFGDAGHILGIAAGVTLVGLAVLAPIALLLLLAWLAQRLWLRTRRERALDA